MPKAKLAGIEERRLLLDAWKAIVDVQMHFNDMLMRIRNLGVTLILAVFGAAAFSLQYELYFRFAGVQVHLAGLVIVFGLFAWGVIGFMDRYYHKLLVGAVAQSRRIEDSYDEDWLGMTTAITRESRTFWGHRDAITARRQIAYFFYLPVFGIGLIYLALVVFYFQASYVKGTMDTKRSEVPSAGRVPEIRQAPVSRPDGGSGEWPALPGSKDSEPSSKPARRAK